MAKISKETKRRQRAKYKVAKLNKSNRPVLLVHKTNANMYGQIIKDGTVLASCSSVAKGVRELVKGKTGAETAQIVGEELGKVAVKNGVKEVVFNKGPYLYAGRVKIFADACRKAGLVF